MHLVHMIYLKKKKKSVHVLPMFVDFLSSFSFPALLPFLTPACVITLVRSSDNLQARGGGEPEEDHQLGAQVHVRH